MASRTLQLLRRVFQAPSSPQIGTAAFLDSNIILEGRALETLPWAEIDPRGPIAVYFVPQVLSEVDRKKHHGRLQTYARKFNRLVGPLAMREVDEVLLVEHPIRVVARLAEPKPIKWEALHGLDRDDGDSRVIAQALHSATPIGLRRVLVSHDVGPIAKASRHGLDPVHVTETWLRPPERSRSESEVTRLREELKEARRDQPDLEIKVMLRSPMPVLLHRVPPVTDGDQIALKKRLGEGVRPMRSIRYDLIPGPEITQAQVDKYLFEDVPAFIEKLPEQLELRHGQVQVTINIVNKGDVHAKDLIVALTSSGGWMNHRILVARTGGPPKPKARDPLGMTQPFILPRSAITRGERDRNELVWTNKPSRSNTAELQCDDFRAERVAEETFVIWIDPRAQRGTVLHVAATASNLKGKVTAHLKIERDVADSIWSDLNSVDGRAKSPYPTEEVMKDAIERNVFEAFDMNSAA